MYGTPASAATLAIFSAINQACTSHSSTHGPAIRNRGLPPPRRKDPRLISLPAVMRSFEDSTEAGELAKWPCVEANYGQCGGRLGDDRALRKLFVDAADDKVDDDSGIDGYGFDAPAPTENA